MKMNPKERKEKAFTLIELLVVIAILAVLAVAVTLILNPAELIRQGRDSTRLSDLATINRALGLYQTDQIAKWMGTSTIVYTSLPDTTSTCASYGLPSLPSGWEYHCVQSSSSTRVNGSGWIPVDFTSMSFSSPLSRLPLDPVNNATTSKYYTYVTGGSWKLSAIFESETRAADAADDGGVDPVTYETGTDLELAPFTHGLTAYWAFDDGLGTTASDSSGYGNNGTINTGTSSVQWVSGKKGGALDFDGVDDYIEAGNDISLQITDDITVLIWVKGTIPGYGDSVISRWDTGANKRVWDVFGGSGNLFGVQLSDDGTFTKGHRKQYLSSKTVYDNNWHQIGFIFNTGTLELYVDGVESTGSVNFESDITFLDSNDVKLMLGANLNNGALQRYSNGTIDEIRIYNRALSAAEIEAMYNSY